jgi:hypothetical protein
MDFNSNFLIAILSIGGSILGIFISYTIGRWQQSNLDKKLKREKYNVVLSDILTLYKHYCFIHWFINSKTLKRLDKIYPNYKTLLEMSQFHDSYEDMQTNYLKTINSIKELNPIRYYKLLSQKDNIIFLSKYIQALIDPNFDKDTIKAYNVAILDILPIIINSLKDVASVISLEIDDSLFKKFSNQVKLTLEDEQSKINIEFEYIMSTYINKLALGIVKNKEGLPQTMEEISEAIENLLNDDELCEKIRNSVL